MIQSQFMQRVNGGAVEPMVDDVLAADPSDTKRSNFTGQQKSRIALVRNGGRADDIKRVIRTAGEPTRWP